MVKLRLKESNKEDYTDKCHLSDTGILTTFMCEVIYVCFNNYFQ